MRTAKDLRSPGIPLLILTLLLLLNGFAGEACQVAPRYVSSTGNVHEYEVVFASVPKGDRLIFSMVNMTGLTAAAVKAGNGWRVSSWSGTGSTWFGASGAATTIRITITSPDPVHATRQPAFWTGGCTSTGNAKGEIRGPWGIPALANPIITAVTTRIRACQTQQAVNTLLRQTRLNTYNIHRGRVVYNHNLEGDGLFTVATKVVEVGRVAFKDATGTLDIPWLYSSIVHESVHAAQFSTWVRTASGWQKRGDTMSVALCEVEAYLMELEFAGRTGLSAARIAELKRRLSGYATTARNDAAHPLSAALRARVEVFLEWSDANDRYKPK